MHAGSRPPSMPPPPPLPPLSPPPVLFWYRIYCWVLLAFLVFAGAVCLAEVAGWREPELGLIERALTIDSPEARSAMIREKVDNARIFLVVAIIGVPALAVGILSTTQSWGFGYGLVLLVASLPLCLPVAATAVLFIFWLKPEVPAYFRSLSSAR